MLDASPTIIALFLFASQAVEEASRRLLAAGFTHITERDAWSLQPGGKYFFTRNMSTIVAFAVGKKYKPGNGCVLAQLVAILHSKNHAPLCPL